MRGWLLLWFVAVGAGATEADTDRVRRLIHLEWQGAAPSQQVEAAAGGGPRVRARLASSLGRSGAQALEPLSALAEDPDPGVRLAAARALIGVPGAAPVARGWLEALGPPRGLKGREEDPQALWRPLLTTLGAQGGPDDVPALLGWLDAPGHAGAAAARSLGWLGAREGLGEHEGAVRGALIEALKRPDRGLRRAAAEALAAVGVGEAQAGPLWHALQQRQDGIVRAHLLAAAWPVLDEEKRESLFFGELMGPWRVSRIAALRAVQPGQIDPFILGTWLHAPDPQIRWAAAEALAAAAPPGALSEDLRALLDGADPYLADAARRWLEPSSAPEPPPVAPAAPPAAPDPVATFRWQSAVLHTDAGRMVLALEPELAPLAVHSLAAQLDTLPWTVDSLEPGSGLRISLGTGPARPEPSHLPLTAGTVCLDATPQGTGALRLLSGPGHALPGECTAVGQVIRGEHLLRALQPGDQIHSVILEEVGHGR